MKGSLLRALGRLLQLGIVLVERSRLPGLFMVPLLRARLAVARLRVRVGA